MICPNLKNKEVVDALNYIMSTQNEQPLSDSELDMLMNNKPLFKVSVSENRLKSVYLAYNNFNKYLNYVNDPANKVKPKDPDPKVLFSKFMFMSGMNNEGYMNYNEAGITEINLHLQKFGVPLKVFKINDSRAVLKYNNKRIGYDKLKSLVDRLDISSNTSKFDKELHEILKKKFEKLYDIITPKIENSPIVSDLSIVGQADIEAMTVLIDAINQQDDTLPHEYAHHYIAWYRDTDIVQKAIALWGSEEALVDAIGKQAVKQKGEAWNWWKEFTDFIISLFGKEEIKNALTDAFLSGVELAATKTFSPGVYNQTTNKLATPIGRTVSNINLRISNLKASYTKNTDPLIAKLINLRINNLKSDIDKLVDRNFEDKPELLKQVATDQLNRASEILESEFIDGNDLAFATNTISIWQFENAQSFMTEEILNEPDSDFYKTFKDIGNTAADLKVKLVKVLQQFIDDIVDNELGSNRKDTDISILKDINKVRALTLSASMSNSDLVMVVDTILKRAKNNQIPLRQDLLAKIDNIFKPLKNKNLKSIIGDNYKLFWQHDETGKPVNRLTYIYSNSWDKLVESDRIKLYNNRIKYNKGEISYETYNKVKNILRTHRSENSILLDYRFLMPGSSQSTNLKGYKFNNPSEYRAYLNNVLGKDLAEQFELEAKAKYSQFLNDRNAVYEDIMNDDNIKDKEAAKNIWDSQFNPIRVMDYKMGNVRDEVKMDRSEKYLVRVPRKYKNGKDTGFYDSNYELISKNTELKLFHDSFIELMNTLKDMLPVTVSQDLADNFIASVHKDLAEKLVGLDIKDMASEVLKHTFDFTTDAIDLNPHPESLRVLRDPITGEQVNLPSIKYIDKFNPDTHTMDLEKIARIFAIQAINYDYMIKVRNTVELMYSFAKTTKTEELGDITGEPTVDPYKKPNYIKQGIGAKNQLDLLRFTIDALLYDKRVDKPNPSKKVMFNGRAKIDDLAKSIEQIHTETFGKPFTFKDKIKKYEMAQEIKLLRDELDFKYERDMEQVMSPEDARYIKQEYKRKMDLLEQKYKELGGTKLVYQNIGNFLINLTQLKGMGFNLNAGVSNLLFGISSDLNHAAGDIEYGYRHFFKALKLFINSLKTPNSKYYNIIKKLDILFEQVDARYDKEYKNKVKNKLSFIDPYVIQNKTEYVNQSLPIIARMFKEKVKLADGSEIVLYELFDDLGNIKLDLLDEQGKIDWNTNLTATTKNKYSQFRDSSVQLNTYLHGNYDPSSPIMAKKSMLGRMLFMFRSWIPMGFASRFLEDRYDNQLGRKIKGRYVTYHDLGMRSFDILLKRLIMSNKTFNETLTSQGIQATDIENMKKNFNEILMVAAMNALMAMLKWSIEDDDEEKSAYDYAALSFINQIYRAEQDVWFYINPNTAYNILKDPIPVTKNILDLQRAVKGTYRYYSDEDYRGQPPYVKWAKVFPFINQIPKMQYLATTDLKEID